MEWFEYLAKASLVLAVVYLTYWLLFRYDTFHRLKRWVLLAGLVLSVGLPLLQITQFQTPVVIDSSQAMSIPIEYWLQMRQSAVAATQEQFSWQEMVLIAYSIVAGVLLLRLISNLVKLFVLLQRHHFRREKDYRLTEGKHVNTPFSFFRFILLPEMADTELRKQILAHEYAHASQYHTLDVLLSELYLVFFWFNPVAWLYCRQVRLNLEYLADASVLQSADQYTYQMSLLKIHAVSSDFSLVNHFHFSSLKHRIHMINRSNSSLQAGLKYIALPVVTVGIVSFFHLSCTQEVEPTLQEKSISEKSEITFRAQQDASDSIESIYFTGNKSALYIVDGKKIDVSEVKKLAPNQIKSMDVFKGENATSLYGEEGKNGVVVITTKPNVTAKPNTTLYIVDGKEMSKEEADKLDPEIIENAAIFHGDKERVKKYGDKAKNGVIEITLKKK